jgi:hypothetical protein
MIDAADARALIETALAGNDRRYDEWKADTWPMLRPLVEWVLAKLPTGGTYRRPEWSWGQRVELVERFGMSPQADGLLDGLDALNAARLLVTFGCDFGTGDPMHWSPVSVEMALDDFFPNHVDAPYRLREMVPDALRRFIRFCHSERAIPEHLTEKTVAAVDRWKWATIGEPGDDYRADIIDRFHTDDVRVTTMLVYLAEAVCGVDALYELDDAPHPDEAFDWAPIPEHIRHKVAEVLERIDACAGELLDVEYRTILRRMLARTATADPSVYTRRRGDIIARTLVWMVCTANDLFRRRTLTVKDLNAWFGLKGSPGSGQATAFRTALGSEDIWSTCLEPAMLHSTRRSWIIEQRDRYTPALDQ